MAARLRRNWNPVRRGEAHQRCDVFGLGSLDHRTGRLFDRQVPRSSHLFELGIAGQPDRAADGARQLVESGLRENGHEDSFTSLKTSTGTIALNQKSFE